MSDLVIDAQGVVKTFGRLRALDGLDLQVRRGEVHGFLGPNGAGKSTALRVLLGLLRADAGSVRVLGQDAWRDVVTIHRRLAYVPGDVSLWPRLSGGQAIDLLGNLRGGLDERRRAHLVDRFELDPTKRGTQYSKGNRQKVALVAALASDVDLLVLDEPTTGLDPLMEQVFRAEVRAEQARGRTVLLSSHVLSEVESLADRVSIIRDGAVVEAGSLTAMRLRSRITVRCTLRRPAPSGLLLPGVADLVVDGARVSGVVDADQLNHVTAALAGLDLLDLAVTPVSLEELFLQHYDRPRDRNHHEHGDDAS